MIKFYIIYSIDIPVEDSELKDIFAERLIESSIPKYIFNNVDKFTITESDNFSQEYKYSNLNTCHRKYVGILNQDEFLEFIKEFEYYSTCDTMGSMTEFGILPAFNVEINDDNIEYLYISLLFDEKLEDNEMIDIENNIRESIENGNINEKMFKLNE